MTLKEAIKRANELQNLVGTVKSDGALRIDAVIPAPTDRRLFEKFITEVKWALLHVDRQAIDFRQIAIATGATDFKVISLHEGTLHESIADMSGNIIWGQLS